MTRSAGPGWLAQVESAIETLRRLPLTVWACYLAGALPFALTLIWFLAETLQSPYVLQRLAPLSLALASAYLWKQTWQAVFMAGIRDHLAGGVTPWTAGRILTAVTRQAFWQPLALLAMPLAALAIVPFPMTLAFFRGMTLEAGRGESPQWRHAAAATTPDFKPHAIALCAIALGGLLLWVNALAVLLMAPSLGESFFGIVTAWSQMGGMLANRVTMAVAAVLMWLVIDPLLDAFYVQRAFRVEARTSGADLEAALKRLLTVVMLALVIVPARAQVTPDQVDRAADQVLKQEEFAWRKAPTLGEEGPVLTWVRNATKWANQKVDDLLDWFRKKFQRNSGQGEASKGGAPSGLQWLLTGLAAVILVLVAVLIFRSWQRAKSVARPFTPVKLTKVDVADENVAADALEESGWLSLADDLAAQGDYRLALRALHLAGLRYLGGRGAVTLARWKSGYEYQRELQRRLRATPQVADIFGGNLLRFEMVWYGRHEATPDAVDQLRQAWKELRVHVA